MAIVPVSGATERFPNVHVTLEELDGSPIVGLMLVDAAGKDDPLAITRSTYPRTATKIASGENKYSDLEPPYASLVENSWDGGRGAENFEDDKSRFLDNYRLNTTVPGQVILGGQDAWANGYRNVYTKLPQDTTFSSANHLWSELTGSVSYRATRFSLTTGFTCARAYVWARKTKATADITFTVNLRSETTSAPGTVIATGTGGLNNALDDQSYLIEIIFTTPVALSSATNYYLDVNNSGATGISVLYNPQHTGFTSANGTVWVGGGGVGGPFFMLTDGVTETSKRGLFFSYLDATYFVTQPPSGNSVLYVNGDRGLATSGGVLALNDSTKTWTTNIFAGARMTILGGTGSDQAQRWRVIASNSATQLVPTAAWDIAPDSTSVYVISTTPVFTPMQTLTGIVTDVASANERVFFAFGNDNDVQVYAEYIPNGGSWTLSLIEAANIRAHYLTWTSNDGKTTLWGAFNGIAYDGPGWFRLDVPPGRWAGYRDMGILASTDTAWSDAVIPSVTQDVDRNGARVTIAAGFTSGVVAANDLDDPIDVTTGNGIGMEVQSSVGFSDLKLRLSDRAYRDQIKLPSALWMEFHGRRHTPKKVLLYKGQAKRLADFANLYILDRLTVASKVASATAALVATDLPAAYDGATSSVAATFSATVSLIVVSPKKFNLARFTFGTNKNNNVETITAKYFNGEVFTAVNNQADSTASGGATFAVDGTVSWTMPGDWGQYLYDDVQGYAVQFTFSGTLDAVDLQEVATLDTEGYGFEPMSRARDGDILVTSGTRFNLIAGDGFTVGHNEKFDRVYVDMGVVNTANSVLTARYFNGEKFTALTITDGTIAAGTDTLGQTGTISFAMPADWTPLEIDGDSGYHILFTVSVTLDEDTRIDELSVYNSQDGTYHDLTELYDPDRVATSTEFPVITSADFLWVGDSQPFDEIRAVVVVGNTIGTAAMSGRYFDGNNYDALVLADGTFATRTLAATGNVTFPIPPDWREDVVESEDGFWIRLGFDASLSADIELSSIQVKNRNELEYVPVNAAADGNTATSVAFVATEATTTSLVVGSDEVFNKVKVNVGTVNTGSSTMAGRYFDGEQLQALTLTDGTRPGSVTLAQDGDLEFTIPDDWRPLNLNGIPAYYVWLTPSSVNEEVALLEVACKYDLYVELDGPTILVNEWTFCKMSTASLLARPYPDMTNVRSVQLAIGSDHGAQILRLRNHIHVIRVDPEYSPMPGRATNIVTYGEPLTEPVILFADAKPHQIDTQNNILAPLRITDIENLADDDNGKAAVHHDVYLWFNLHGRIQRYFDGNLENIGPDRDAGLPRNRTGSIAFLLGYPGMLIAGVNAGSTGYSSILVYRSGWSEIMRMPYGKQLYSGWVQVTPGEAVDRLWFNCGDLIGWIPLPSYTSNPLGDPAYPYTHESHYITGWMTAGLADVDKLWTRCKLFTQFLGTDANVISTYIQVEYQANSGLLESGWTPLPSTYTISPVEEHDIATNYVIAKKIRFRVRLFTDSMSVTPVLNALVIECLVRVPTKNSYTIRFRLADRDRFIPDAEGYDPVENLNTQIETWHNSPIPLRMKTWFSPYSPRIVVIETLGSVPFGPIVPEEQHEMHIGEMTLLEV